MIAVAKTAAPLFNRFVCFKARILFVDARDFEGEVGPFVRAGLPSLLHRSLTPLVFAIARRHLRFLQPLLGACL